MMSSKNNLKRAISYHDHLIKALEKKTEATTYLKIALEEYEKDGNTEVFLLALRNVAEAQGGVAELSKKTKLNRQNLYRILSSKGNPRLDTLAVILRALGFRLSISRLKA